MQPFLVGQNVQISDATTLALRLQEAPALLSLEHLAQAGKRAAIRTVSVANHAGNQYFFYTLDGSNLLWPHGAIAISGVRRLTVNVARPMKPRAPGMTTYPPGLDAVKETYLYVGNMSYEMSDTALVHLVRRFGGVESVQLVMDKMTRRSKGFAFVWFQHATAARKAVTALNGSEVADFGELVSAYETDKYLAWLRRSWSVSAMNLIAYDEQASVATQITFILEESSRRLAQCVADYPHSLVAIEWRDFERMLAEIFEGLGFGVECGRGSKDGGVDLRLKTSSTTYIVQAKHWVSGKKVGADALRATLTVAMSEGQGGAIVLSSSGFTRNAATAITGLQRTKLRIGGSWEIHSLCRAYVSVDDGLLLPIDPDGIIKTYTRPI